MSPHSYFDGYVHKASIEILTSLDFDGYDYDASVEILLSFVSMDISEMYPLKYFSALFRWIIQTDIS